LPGRAATIGLVRRNPCTVIVLAGPVGAEVLTIARGNKIRALPGVMMDFGANRRSVGRIPGRASVVQNVCAGQSAERAAGGHPGSTG